MIGIVLLKEEVGRGATLSCFSFLDELMDVVVGGRWELERKDSACLLLCDRRLLIFSNFLSPACKSEFKNLITYYDQPCVEQCVDNTIQFQQ